QMADVLQAALDCASDGVLILDCDFHIRHLNPAAASIWGVERTELAGSHVGRLGLEDLMRHLALAIPAQAPSRERVDLSDMTIHRKDGSRIRAALSLWPLETGGDSRYVLFVRDITHDVEQRERLTLLHELSDRSNRAV